MYTCMVNLVIFTSFVTIHVKYNSVKIYKDVQSLIICSIAAVIYLYTFVMFCCDPDAFDYFRYSFRK